MSRPEDTAIVYEDEPAVAYQPDPFPLVRWWRGLDAVEQTLYGGLASLSAGLAAVSWPLAFIVPGAVLTFLALFTVGVITLRGRDG